MRYPTLFAIVSLAFTLSGFGADDYQPGPDSKKQSGVPEGTLTKYSWSNSKIFPDTVRDYWVYVPKQYDGSKPACVFVCQDGQMYSAPLVFDNLIHKKEIPVTIGIFIRPGDKPLKPGEVPRKRPDGRPAPASNRSFEYDTLSDAYARFLLEEILPEVAKKYKLTSNPEGRAIGGSSSGGHLRLHGGVAEARCLPQGVQHGRQFHEHPRRRKISRAGSRGGEEANSYLHAGWLGRPRQSVRLVARGE